MRLYSLAMTDALLSLARAGLFAARWTTEVEKEWIRSLERQRPDRVTQRKANHPLRPVVRPTSFGAHSVVPGVVLEFAQPKFFHERGDINPETAAQTLLQAVPATNRVGF